MHKFFLKELLVKVLIITLLFFTGINTVNAQGSGFGYEIDNFVSEIVIEKDTSLNIKETIQVNFVNPRHGIIRVIPVTYTSKGRTIHTRFDLVDVKDDKGVSHKYQTSKLGQSVSIKIGDPDVYVSGLKTYVINYNVSKVLQRYDEHDELYWNVTGSEWDTLIHRSSISVESSYAPIIKVECFAGPFGGSDRFCQGSSTSDKAYFSSTTELGLNRDFTIVVGVDKNNSLAFPGYLENAINNFLDNWAYLPSVFPLIIIFFYWFKKGRDRKFTSGNPYFETEDKSETNVKLFERSQFSFTYHPIEGLTPTEVGTVIDEKVDIADIVAEITELARLGLCEIRKIERKKLIGSTTDFAFIKTSSKENVNLRDYQKYLFDEIFKAANIKKSKNKNNQDVLKLQGKQEFVLLSELKGNFYKVLPEFKKKLYARMETEKIFSGDPEKVRAKWVGILILLEFIAGFLVFNYSQSTANFGPVMLLVIFFIPSLVMAISMPRRTAKGYALYIQIKGLRWYLQKGKWRHEIAEKHLFFEEILPLAISLGVVGKLVSYMKNLGVNPPNYFSGTSSSSFTSDLLLFQTVSSRSFLTTPQGTWSGSSSWSGGSGFSGGSSGGGFGGGGGGSW